MSLLMEERPLTKSQVRCREKQAYASRLLADNMSYLLHVAKGQVTHAYRCPECGDFHLTSKGENPDTPLPKPKNDWRSRR